MLQDVAGQLSGDFFRADHRNDMTGSKNETFYETERSPDLRAQASDNDSGSLIGRDMHCFATTDGKNIARKYQREESRKIARVEIFRDSTNGGDRDAFANVSTFSVIKSFRQLIAPIDRAKEIQTIVPYASCQIRSCVCVSHVNITKDYNARSNFGHNSRAVQLDEISRRSLLQHFLRVEYHLNYFTLSEV